MLMKKILFIACLAVFLSGCKQYDGMQAVINKGIKRSVEQTEFLAKAMEADHDSLPRSYTKQTGLVKSDSHWWCSGFFPGELWYLYEATGSPKLKRYAEIYTQRVAEQQYTTDNHDIGFILMCSFGNAYRLTHSTNYVPVLLNGAQSLSTRFNPVVGLIRSWDTKTDKWQYPVIIDNMMNLELLEWAARHSDSAKFAKIASSHARLTMKNHFRHDFSSYHVVSYDPRTGLVEKKNTHQGYAHESAWARGQAWGLYGYTMMFRETGDSIYLNHAKGIARFIMSHPNMPKDKIPYWDFNAPDIPHAKRDASAAAIMAAAFIELSCLTKESPDFSKQCLNMAGMQLRSLTSDEYLAKKGTNGGFILKHSVGNYPKGTEVDVPLTYADYYYVEALVRYKKLLQKPIVDK